MATNINGIRLKKCNVDAVKCKRINVNGVKVWTGEESFINTEASIYHAHDDLSDWEPFEIDIPEGETFRIDSITYTTASSYSESKVQVYINGKCIKDFGYVRGGEAGKDFVTVLTNTEIYTAESTPALQIKTRGCVSRNQHSDYPRVTITVKYTTGV